MDAVNDVPQTVRSPQPIALPVVPEVTRVSVVLPNAGQTEKGSLGRRMRFVYHPSSLWPLGPGQLLSATGVMEG